MPGFCSARGGDLNGDALFFDPSRHREALALLASEHLGRGEYAAAFQFADRRCRLLKPDARDYLLRSEASRRAGHEDFAARDLARAFEIDPTDRFVASLVLAWGPAEQKLALARKIVDDPLSERDNLRRALALLFEDGAKLLFHFERLGESLCGWAAWSGTARLSLRVEAGEARVFEPAAEPKHRLAGANRACADIELAADGAELRRLAFLLDGVEVEVFSPPPAPRPREGVVGRPATAAASGALTIVAPVYEDFEATRACFEALFAEGSKIATRLIVIDDASPNPRLRAWLDQQATARNFTLLRNASNLGFAASVNKALALCPAGDVLLLNADTLPSPRCVERLAAIAHSAPGIGTVTPLSNNGEFTSFPEPHAVNPLGGAGEVARLDALAQRANGAATADLPNGIGFCLYITRECLDAVGPLPEIYARGYYEDVEFCLRAREKGFRNVCAVGVYVGHAGARSFGAEKRRLVMRNLAVLEQRFPGYSLECAAFLRSDPLSPYRGAIEALAPVEGEVVLLVCGEGTSGLLAREELSRERPSFEPVRLICQCTSAGDRVLLRGVPGRGPQSLSFSLREARELAGLRAWLGALDLRGVEIFDPLTLPDVLLKTMFRLRTRVDLAGADFESVFPARPPVEGPCRDMGAPGPCGGCASPFSRGDAEGAHALALKRRRALLSKAQSIKPLDRMSEVFARAIFGESFVAAAPVPASASVFAHGKTAGGALSIAGGDLSIAGGALAIIAPAPCVLADRLIIGLGRALLRRGDTTRIVVLGECLDDLAAMGPGNVFVAGKVETDEYDRLLSQYEISALMSPYRTRFFGRIDRLSLDSGLPKACFDWTFGKLDFPSGDLALDPRLCDAKASARIADWLGSVRRGSAER